MRDTLRRSVSWHARVRTYVRTRVCVCLLRACMRVTYACVCVCARCCRRQQRRRRSAENVARRCRPRARENRSDADCDARNDRPGSSWVAVRLLPHRCLNSIAVSSLSSLTPSPSPRRLERAFVRTHACTHARLGLRFSPWPNRLDGDEIDRQIALASS